MLWKVFLLSICIAFANAFEALRFANDLPMANLLQISNFTTVTTIHQNSSLTTTIVDSSTSSCLYSNSSTASFSITSSTFALSSSSSVPYSTGYLGSSTPCGLLTEPIKTHMPKSTNLPEKIKNVKISNLEIEPLNHSRSYAVTFEFELTCAENSKECLENLNWIKITNLHSKINSLTLFDKYQHHQKEINPKHWKATIPVNMDRKGGMYCLRDTEIVFNLVGYQYYHFMFGNQLPEYCWPIKDYCVPLQDFVFIDQ